MPSVVGGGHAAAGPGQCTYVVLLLLAYGPVVMDAVLECTMWNGICSRWLGSEDRGFVGQEAGREWREVRDQLWMRGLGRTIQSLKGGSVEKRGAKNAFISNHHSAAASADVDSLLSHQGAARGSGVPRGTVFGLQIGNACRLRGGEARDAYEGDEGQILEEKGMSESTIEAALRADPTNVENLSALATSKLEGGDVKGSLELFNRALALQPTTCSALCARIYLSKQLGDADGAERDTETVLRLYHNDSKALCDVAAVLQDMSAAHVQRAKDLYKRALELDPNDVSVLCNYAGLLINQRPHPEEALTTARTCLERASELSPNSFEVLINLGALQQVFRDYKAANFTYSRASLLCPTHPAVLCGLASCAEHIASAYRDAQQNGALAPGTAKRLTHTSAESASATTREEAELAYQKAIGANPQDTTTLFNYAGFCERMWNDGGDQEWGRRAIELYEELLRKTGGNGKDDYQVLFQLGRQYLFRLEQKYQCNQSTSDERAKAEACFKRASEVDPTQAGALTMIAVVRSWAPDGAQKEGFGQEFLMADHELQVHKAREDLTIKILQRAIELDPNDVIALAYLGTFLSYRRDHHSSAELLRRSLELEPSQPKTMQIYAWVLNELFQHDMARKVCDRSTVMMLMEQGMTQQEAEEKMELDLRDAQYGDEKLRRLRQAMNEVTDDEIFSKIDKRQLTDEDWSTSIGAQGGTVFNVTSLRAKGLIQINTPEQEKWYQSYIKRHFHGKHLEILPPQDLARRLKKRMEDLGYSIDESVDAENGGQNTRMLTYATPTVMPLLSDGEGGGVEAGGRDAGGKEGRRGVGAVEILDAGDTKGVADAVQRKLELLHSKSRSKQAAGAAEGEVAEADGQIQVSNVSFQGIISVGSSRDDLVERTVESRVGAWKELGDVTERGWAGETEIPFGPENFRTLTVPGRLSKGMNIDVPAEAVGTYANVRTPAWTLPGEEQSPDPQAYYRHVMLSGFGGGLIQDTVEVTGLHEDVDGAALKEAFSVFGEVVAARVRFRPSTGQSKGSGRVTFAAPEAAAAAIERAHKKQFGDLHATGKVLWVKYAWRKVKHLKRRRRDDVMPGQEYLKGKVGRQSLIEQRIAQGDDLKDIL